MTEAKKLFEKLCFSLENAWHTDKFNTTHLCIPSISSCSPSCVLGAHAEDWTKWRSQLYNLYDALVREISHIGSRGKYVTGTRHIAVKDNLIKLTADICHQVIALKSQVCIKRNNLMLSMRMNCFDSIMCSSFLCLLLLAAVQ